VSVTSTQQLLLLASGDSATLLADACGTKDAALALQSVEAKFNYFNRKVADKRGEIF
jgi:hypothetical protein